MIRSFLLLFIFFGFFIPWQSSLAFESWWDDTVLMPQYCKDRAQAGNKPDQVQRWKRWKRTFGSAYIHMHHYCEGVHAEMQAKMTTAKLRNKYLKEVTVQMEYVSRNCSTDCVLYPELHTRWAWALLELGQVADGFPHYHLAIRAKPTYTPAYARLADFYVQTSQLDEARKILKQGLELKPSSSSLKRRLRKLEKF